METVLIIASVALVVVLIAIFGRRALQAGQERRREKAGELRVEAAEGTERARRAEASATREREAAEKRAAMADKLDPDVDSSDVDVDEDDDEDASRSKGGWIRDRLARR